MVSLNVRYFDRFGAIRPGYDLVGLVSVALPVTFLRVDVLAQQPKDLPLLEEFVLRLVAQDLATSDQIAEVLGLESGIVQGAIATQIDESNLDYVESTGALTLTEYGGTVVEELRAMAPLETTLEVAFDRVLWELSSHRLRDGFTAGEVATGGWAGMRAPRRARIDREDVPVRTLNDLLEKRRGRREDLEVLLVNKVHADIHRFVPAEVLVYLDARSGEVGFELLVDGDLSDSHRDAFAQAGEFATLHVEAGVAPEPPRFASALSGRLGNGDGIRELSGLEHWDLLEDLILSTERRLLVASTTANSNVVTRPFLAQIERLLARGVRVHVAVDVSGCEESVADSLESLSARYSGGLTFALVPEMPHGALISDGTLILSSFPWLGFDAAQRMPRVVHLDRGIAISNHAEVDGEYERYRIFVEEDATASST